MICSGIFDFLIILLLFLNLFKLLKNYIVMVKWLTTLNIIRIVNKFFEKCSCICRSAVGGWVQSTRIGNRKFWNRLFRNVIIQIISLCAEILDGLATKLFLWWIKFLNLCQKRSRKFTLFFYSVDSILKDLILYWMNIIDCILEPRNWSFFTLALVVSLNIARAQSCRGFYKSPSYKLK